MVRIGDVARAAGVSVATVSKALNDRPDVSAATRERVLREAQRLDFRPDPRARSLSTGRSFAVGLLTTDVYGRFSLPLLMGVEDELGDRELAVIFGDTRATPTGSPSQLRTLVSRHVDGIIVNGRRIEDRPRWRTPVGSRWSTRSPGRGRRRTARWCPTRPAVPDSRSRTWWARAAAGSGTSPGRAGTVRRW